MLHLREPFEPRQFRCLHRAEFAHLAEIVAKQIGNHHQFGQFLLAGLQFVGELRVVCRIGVARACALDGPRLDVRTAQAQKLFR